VAPRSYIVEDHRGNRQRGETPANIAALRFPTVIAPIRREHALKALRARAGGCLSSTLSRSCTNVDALSV